MKTNYNAVARDVVNEIERDYGNKGMVLIIQEALQAQSLSAKRFPSREEVMVAFNETWDSLERTHDFDKFYDWLKAEMDKND